MSRALRILLHVGDPASDHTLSGISAALSLSLATAHRILKTLELQAFVTKDKDSNRYAPGPAIMQLAQVILRNSESDHVVVVAAAHLERLRALSGETVGLHFRFAEDRICLSEFPSHQPMRMVSGLAQIYPLAAGAAGKVLIAWESKEEIETALDRLSGRPLKSVKLSRAMVRKELARVRQAGYAVSRGETVAGASALAAPIRDSASGVRAALNITGPDSRWTVSKMRSVIPALLDACERISAQLGWQNDLTRTAAPATGASVMTKEEEKLALK